MHKIDAVGMVRRIRDEQYDKTKGLSREELLRYYREKGQEAFSRLRKAKTTPRPKTS